jgi:hypothetical protein
VYRLAEAPMRDSERLNHWVDAHGVRKTVAVRSGGE